MLRLVLVNSVVKLEESGLSRGIGRWKRIFVELEGARMGSPGPGVGAAGLAREGVKWKGESTRRRGGVKSIPGNEW